MTGLFLGFLMVWMGPLAQQPAQQSKHAPTASARPKIVWHRAGEIEVPFEYFRQHIYVNVSLNGKPGYVFMLDSGASRNILNLRTAREMGMQPGSVVQEKNIGFGDRPVYVAPQENVTAEIKSVPVANTMSVMDLARFEQHFGHRTDGMLGYPFFQRFVVNVDFQKKLLFIFPPDRYRYRGWGIQVAIKPDPNFVILPVTIGGMGRTHREVNLAVDTGSDVTLMLYEPFVKELHLEESLQKSIHAMAFGLNGYYPVRLGSVHSFLIGDAETHAVPVDYLADTEEVGSERGLPGAIGMGVIKSFREVIFDVPHERMVFELKAPLLTTSRIRTVTY